MRLRTKWVRGTTFTLVLAGWGSVFMLAFPMTLAGADDARSKAQQAASDSGLTWVRTGGPIGGIGYDIRSRPDNPDVMFVTDAGGGAHRSEDGGETWVPSNSGIDVRSGGSLDGIPVFSLTIDPHDNNIVWAGTQSRLGIYRSSDGGRTWVRKVTGITGDTGISVRGFTVDPLDSRIVYAAAELSSTVWAGQWITGKEFELVKGAVYKTVDGGEHWTQIWYGDNLARYVWIDPGNRNLIYVSTGFFDREAGNSNPAANFAGGVGILKSADGGRTWRALNQANGLGNLYVGSLCMHPTNPNILLAATGNNQYSTGAGVYLTTDGGESWTHTLSDGGGAFGAVEITVSSPNIAYAGSGGGAFRSDDGGRTWTRYISPGSEANPFWGPPGLRAGFPIDLEADLRDPMRVFANMYGGGNLLSMDGGETWADASRGYTGAMMLSVAIDQTDPAHVYSVAVGTGTFQSTDRGTNWQGVNTERPIIGSAFIVVSPTNGREVLMSDAMTGRLWKSVDGAHSWELVLDHSQGIETIPVENVDDRRQGLLTIAYAPSDARIVYAGMAMRTCAGQQDSRACGIPTYEGVHRSTDGGTTWQTTLGEGLGLQSVLALAVHPANPDIVYAGTGAGVFKTENGGRTWVSINQGLSSIYIRSVAIDASSSPDTVYVGTVGAAIFKSTDGGASWRASSAGLLPNGDIRALLVDPTNPSVLWAGDWSTGVYRSTDAGATWALMNVGLSTRSVMAMAISDDGGTVYAGTQGAGVFRLDLPVAPRVRSHPSSTTVRSGGMASFTAAASGTPTPMVQWQASTNGGSTWSDISGATATTYSYTAEAADNGKRYRAVFTNSLGSASSNPATLTIGGRRRGVRH